LITETVFRASSNDLKGKIARSFKR